MMDPTEPLGARIERILGGADHYEKIAQLVWIIQEYAYQALSTLAQKEEWADDALKVALVAASNRYDNLHERYHQDLRRVLDMWDEAAAKERLLVQLRRQVKDEKHKVKMLRAKVKAFKHHNLRISA